MFTRTVAVALALATLALLAPSPTQAWSTRVNYLSFNTAVRLPGALLTPGTYTFESGPQGSDPDVVRVSNRRGDKVLFQGFTIAVSRPAAGPTVSLGEAPQGAPQPIIVWYVNGANTGHRFQYQ